MTRDPSWDHPQRRADYQKRRYWSDEAFRLRAINRARERKGQEPIASLSEMGSSRHGRARDERGRFA